jgi:hypothetical protein
MQKQVRLTRWEHVYNVRYDVSVEKFTNVIAYVIAGTSVGQWRGHQEIMI